MTTTSCDAVLRIDLLCDACDASFAPPGDTPPVAAIVWALARADGWLGGPTAAHSCPSCAWTEGTRTERVRPRGMSRARAVRRVTPIGAAA